MNKQLLTGMLTVALGALSGTAILAQTVPLQADVPFNFQIGGKKLPAGVYTEQLTGPTNVLLVVTRAGGRTGGIPDLKR
jgi:hypothetical protein